jgi:hypothetical protein
MATETYKITVKRLTETGKWKVEQKLQYDSLRLARGMFNVKVSKRLINESYIEPISITLSDGFQILSTFTIR